MPSFAPQDIFVPEDGQTEFTLPHPYVMGTGELKVYLNGILAIIDHDYTEVDNTKINFLYQLTKEDIVITQHMVYFDDKLVKVIDNTGKGLYQKLGVEDRLLKNQKYELTFKHGVQTLTASFYTQMTPLYSTVEIIRNDLPDVFKNLKDQTIRMQLYLNSILARNIAGEEQLSAINAAPPIPFYAKQYVRYRTELDLLIAMYIALTGKPSSDHVVLGSLEVEKRFRVEDVRAFIDEIKAKLKPWETALKGTLTSNLIATAVRGGSSNPYPLNSPRRDVSPSGFGSDA